MIKTIYIKIPGNESPKTESVYFTNLGMFCYWVDEGWNGENLQIDYWLQPVKENKFSIDFSEWCGENFHSFGGGVWQEPETGQEYTTDELCEKFIEEYRP